MRLSRRPTSPRFFELFADIGNNIAASAEVLREFVRSPDERRAELAERMHELEHTGDKATHEIIELLDRSFVTPSTARTSTGWPPGWTTWSTTWTPRWT